MMAKSEFSEGSAFDQEEKRKEQLRIGKIVQLTQDEMRSIADRVNAGLQADREAYAQRQQKTAGVSEQDVMELRSDLEHGLIALRAGDTGSAISMIERVHDRLYEFLR